MNKPEKKSHHNPDKHTGISTLSELALSLGVKETLIMQELHTRIVEAMKTGTSFIDCYIEYEDFLIQNDNGSIEYRLGIILLKATIFLEGGDMDSYHEEIDQAYEYAQRPQLRHTIPDLDKITR